MIAQIFAKNNSKYPVRVSIKSEDFIILTFSLEDYPIHFSNPPPEVTQTVAQNYQRLEVNSLIYRLLKVAHVKYT